MTLQQLFQRGTHADDFPTGRPQCLVHGKRFEGTGSAAVSSAVARGLVSPETGSAGRRCGRGVSAAGCDVRRRHGHGVSGGSATAERQYVLHRPLADASCDGAHRCCGGRRCRCEGTRPMVGNRREWRMRRSGRWLVRLLVFGLSRSCRQCRRSVGVAHMGVCVRWVVGWRLATGHADKRVHEM
jgi:hypothetical protein